MGVDPQEVRSWHGIQGKHTGKIYGIACSARQAPSLQWRAASGSANRMWPGLAPDAVISGKKRRAFSATMFR